MSKTTKIEAGVYKHINADGETWILRGGQYWDAGQTYWIANQSNELNDCSDENSACQNFDTKAEAINFLNS